MLIIAVFLLTGLLSAAQGFGLVRSPSSESTSAVMALDCVIFGAMIVGVVLLLVKSRRHPVAGGDETGD